MKQVSISTCAGQSHYCIKRSKVNCLSNHQTVVCTTELTNSQNSSQHKGMAQCCKLPPSMSDSDTELNDSMNARIYSTNKNTTPLSVISVFAVDKPSIQRILTNAGAWGVRRRWLPVGSLHHLDLGLSAGRKMSEKVEIEMTKAVSRHQLLGVCENM